MLLFDQSKPLPSTPSTRNGAVDRQVKSNTRNNLIYGQHHCSKGCNARGIIPARHRGGGHKHLYRKIDFRRNEKDIYGRIVTIEYDPNRNAYLCLIHYGDGEKRYILHPRGASTIFQLLIRYIRTTTTNSTTPLIVKYRLLVEPCELREIKILQIRESKSFIKRS